MSEERVFGGIGAKIINKFSDLLFKGLDKMFEAGVDIDQVKEEKNEETGNDVLKYRVTTGGGNIVLVTMEKLKEGRYDVVFTDIKGSHEKKIENVHEDKLDDELVNYIEKQFGGESVEDVQEGYEDRDNVKQSTVLGFTKITKGDISEVTLTKVIASSENIQECAEAVADIMSDDDVLDEIDDGDEQLYELEVSDTDYELTPVEEVVVDDTFNPVLVMMQAAYQLYADCNTIHWNMIGDKNQFYALLEDEYSVKCQLDELAALSMEIYGYAPCFNCLSSQCGAIDTSHGIDFIAGKEIIENDIRNYIDSMELMKCNLADDIKLSIDSYIRTMKHWMDYKIKTM